MATLTSAISATATVIPVTGTAPEPGSFFTVGSENIRFLGTSRGPQGRSFRRTYWSVDRGVAGTTKATHSGGATLTQYYPESSAGGGGGGSISVTDGTTTVDPATSLSLPLGTLTDLGGGVAGMATSSAIYVSDVDPGAVGARNLWLNIAIYPQWFVRSEADDAWETAGPPGWANANIGLISSPDDTAELALHNDGQGPSAWYAEEIQITGGGKRLYIDASGIHIGAAGPVLLSGAADPSVGGGVVATEGSVYLRTDGTLWVKSGAGDTAWTGPLTASGFTNSSLAAYVAAGEISLTSAGQPIVLNAATSLNITAATSLGLNGSALTWNGDPIGTQAAHVADGSTVDQLRDALIASGLMAAS